MDDQELREYFRWRIWCDTRTLLDYSGNDPDMAEDVHILRVLGKHLNAEALEAVSRHLHEAVAETRKVVVEAMTNGDAENPYHKPVSRDDRCVIDRWLDSQRDEPDPGADDHA